MFPSVCIFAAFRTLLLKDHLNVFGFSLWGKSQEDRTSPFLAAVAQVPGSCRPYSGLHAEFVDGWVDGRMILWMDEWMQG